MRPGLTILSVTMKSVLEVIILYAKIGIEMEAESGMEGRRREGGWMGGGGRGEGSSFYKRMRSLGIVTRLHHRPRGN